MKLTAPIKISEKIRSVIDRVSREVFLPAELKKHTNDDEAFPIGYEQTTSQPSVIAVMLDFLDLKPGQKVLYIGSLNRYPLALIS